MKRPHVVEFKVRHVEVPLFVTEGGTLTINYPIEVEGGDLINMSGKITVEAEVVKVTRKPWWKR